MTTQKTTDPEVQGALSSIINGDKTQGAGETALGLTRIALGWTFAWAFLDKLFGLGFDTCRLEDGSIDTMCDSAFISGGSPTWGFLTFGTAGSKTGDWFSWLASSGPGDIGIADLLYMVTLLVAGFCFMTGIALRVGAVAGVGLMLSIYLASSVWPQFNPFMDEHLIYSLAMVALAGLGAGRYVGLADSWASSELGRKYPFLR